MRIRKTTLQDVEEVMEVIEYGRKLIRESGNHVQWQSNYPASSDIERDINNDVSFVCVVDEDDDADLELGTIIGTMCIQDEVEPTYNVIDGEWLNDLDYVTIHRIASNQSIKGIGQFCMEYAKEHYANIKIDTHQLNKAMIYLIEKSGFTYCGEIIVADGTPRKAYQYSKI